MLTVSFSVSTYAKFQVAFQVTVLQIWTCKAANSFGLPSPIIKKSELDLLCFRQKSYFSTHTMGNFLETNEQRMNNRRLSKWGTTTIKYSNKQ